MTSVAAPGTFNFSGSTTHELETKKDAFSLEIQRRNQEERDEKSKEFRPTLREIFRQLNEPKRIQAIEGFNKTIGPLKGFHPLSPDAPLSEVFENCRKFEAIEEQKNAATEAYYKTPAGRLKNCRLISGLILPIIVMLAGLISAVVIYKIYF